MEHDINIGDTARHSVEGVVIGSTPNLITLNVGGDRYFTEPENVTVTRRKPRPRPKVGDILNGPQVAEVRWKRGSLIRAIDTGQHGMLDAEGVWRFTGGGTLGFHNMKARDYWRYEVVFVA